MGSVVNINWQEDGMKHLGFGLGLLLLGAGEAYAQAPAARQGDPTNHGGALVTGTPTPPHVGGQIINGSSTVFIGGKPAARVGDTIVEVGATSTIAAGSPTVRIGD